MIVNTIRYIFLLGLIISSGISNAQPNAIQLNPVSWTFSFSKDKVKAGETVELVFKGKIKDEWYMYSSDFSPTLGPNVTTFSFAPNASYKLEGKLKPVGSHKKYDAIWEGEYTYFKKEVEFRQKVKILKPNPKIAATINYQVCNDVTGTCLPPFDTTYTFKKLEVIGELIEEKAPPLTHKETTAVVEKQTQKSPKNVAELEAEKNNLIKKDEKGNDISIQYLKNFVNQYGGVK